MSTEGKGKKALLDLDDPLENDPLASDALANDALESGVVPVPTVKPPGGPMRDRQVTFVDDDLTEQARIASVLIDSMPPQDADPNGARAIRTRLAPLDRIPALAKSIDELGDDLKEPKTAFVLGFVDGVLPLETIIEVTGLPEVETLRILEQLIAQGAVIFPTRR